MTKCYLYNTKTSHTRHSSIRSQQRNINDTQIQMVLEYGEMILQNSDQIIYYFSEKLYNKLTKNKFISSKVNKLIGLVVIMFNDIIVTTYRCKDAKKIYKKYKHCEILTQF